MRDKKNKLTNKMQAKEKDVALSKKINYLKSYVFKIQVAASATMPDKNNYSNLGNVEIIQNKGMYKVIIDEEFTTKEEALRYREQVIQKGYRGSFLVNYKNEKRVDLSV